MRLSVLTFILSLTALGVGAAEEDEDKPWTLSPDKNWEFKLVDSAPTIRKAGSADTALELPGADSSLTAKSGEVVWAPDSRRFVFNYRAGGRYRTCSAFELVGSTWKQLPDFEEKAEAVQNIIKRAKIAQVKKLGLTATKYQRRIDDTWRARRWLDDDTLELFAFSESTVAKGEDIESVSCGVLFRIKCDNRGGWKVVSTRVVSGAELEKLQSEVFGRD